MAWTMRELNEKIQKVMARNKNVGREEYRMYVVIPYLATLGYDVYDMSEVVLNAQQNKITVNVSDEIKLTVSMDNLQIPQTFEKDGTSIYLVIDAKENLFTLYTLALGEWEKLYSVDIDDVDDEQANEDYISMIRYLVKDSILSDYSDKGARIFTEGAVNKLISNRDYNNRFLQEILRTEIETPSKEFIALIVSRLSTKYTTHSPDDLFMSLQELSTTGLVGIIDSAIGLSTPQEDTNLDNNVYEEVLNPKINELLTGGQEEPEQVKEPVQEKELVEIELPEAEEEIKEPELVEEEELQQEESNEDIAMEKTQEMPLQEQIPPVEEEKQEETLDLGALIGGEEEEEETGSSMSLNDLFGGNDVKEETGVVGLGELFNETTEDIPQAPPIIVESIANNDDDYSEDYATVYDEYADEKGGLDNLNSLQEVVIGEPLSVDAVNLNIKDKEEIKIKDTVPKRPNRMNTRSSSTKNSRLEALRESMKGE